MKKYLRHDDVLNLAQGVAERIYTLFGSRPIGVYPIPRGGVPAAYAVNSCRPIKIVDTAEEADAFIDDIVDSGATQARYASKHPTKPMLALVDRIRGTGPTGWIVWPWENVNPESSVEDNVVRMLQFIGEDPTRGGLVETPKRVVKAWGEWFSGYKVKPEDVIKGFKDGAEHYDEMVLVKGIPFYSHCEHHLAPFFGTATVAYIPNGEIIGLSKVSRLVDIFARRLQVQERMTGQIAESLSNAIKPKGVGVVVSARHLCMESRGIKQQGHDTTTSSLKGVFLKDSTVRSEFLRLAKGL